MIEKPVTAVSIKMIAKITSYEGGQLCGILDSLHFEEPFAFSGVVSMIEMMETTFDALGFPDKALLPRTFGKAKERMRRNEIDLAKLLEKRAAGDLAGAAGDSIAVFEIFVNFRLNAEWQGKLHWVDKGVTKEFHSIVELAKLLDEALG